MDGQSALTDQSMLQVTANDIYSTSLAWFAAGRSTADVQISSICPATEKVSID
jgi:hypothetical protein